MGDNGKSAERMARYRERQKNGKHVIQVELTSDEYEAVCVGKEIERAKEKAEQEWARLLTDATANPGVGWTFWDHEWTQVPPLDDRTSFVMQVGLDDAYWTVGDWNRMQYNIKQKGWCTMGGCGKDGERFQMRVFDL